MKPKVCWLLSGLLVSGCLTNTQSVTPVSKSTPDQFIAREVMERDTRLKRITAKPLRVDPPYSALCKSPHAAVEQSPHDYSYVHVYMNVPGVNALKTGMTNYPVGTIVLKEKKRNPDQVIPSLFTGMIKQEKGYHPEAGDWEFFVTTGKGDLVVARGKISSCLDCHSRHHRTDYLTGHWKPALIEELKP